MLHLKHPPGKLASAFGSHCFAAQKKDTKKRKGRTGKAKSRPHVKGMPETRCARDSPCPSGVHSGKFSSHFSAPSRPGGRTERRR